VLYFHPSQLCIIHVTSEGRCVLVPPKLCGCGSISVMICTSHSDEIVLLSTKFHWTVYVCLQPGSYVHFSCNCLGFVFFGWVYMVHYPSLLLTGSKSGTTILYEVLLFLVCTVHDNSTGVVTAVIFKWLVVMIRADMLFLIPLLWVMNWPHG